MPKITKTTNFKNGFSFETKISDYKEKNSIARITVPMPKVRELELVGKKLKVTIEIIDEKKVNLSKDDYKKLGYYLESQNKDNLELGFKVIEEEIINKPLPPAARIHPGWWSNDRKEHTQSKFGWLNFGFKTKLINIQDERVVFIKK